MTKRLLSVSAAVLVLALAAPIAAQAQSIFLSAGAGIPTGDDSEFISTGWMAAAGFIFDVGTNGVWAGIDGTYGRNSTDFSGDGDISIKPWSIMGVLGYSFPTDGSVDPYVYGGAGLMGMKVSDDTDSLSESGFGWQGGAGVSFGGADAKARPYVEGRYQRASLTFEGDSSSTSVAFFGALVGVTIGVGN